MLKNYDTLKEIKKKWHQLFNTISKIYRDMHVLTFIKKMHLIICFIVAEKEIVKNLFKEVNDVGNHYKVIKNPKQIIDVSYLTFMTCKLD